MAKQATASVPTVKVTLRIPEATYDAYAERAAKLGREPETEINARLASCIDHTGSGAIYIDNDTRNQLTQVAGRLIQTPADLTNWAKRVASLQVGGVTIELTEQLATRLRSRTFGHTWDEYITRTVTEALEQSVGMR